jgi:hypothetical protein
MIEEYEKRKRKQVSLMRSMLDFGMGILILTAGIFFFFREWFHTSLNDKFPPDSVDKLFGVMCMIYGVWRIYRGVKKKYFR